MHQQVRRNVHARHIAITRDGICVAVDRRHDRWGYTSTIPFDQITECEILEPAGNKCFCIKQVLYLVNVDTISSSGSNNKNGVQHKLSISGLKEPYKFQALVLAMKRVQSQGIATSPSAVLLPLPTATATATAFPLAQLEEAELELVTKSTTGSSSQPSSDTPNGTSVTALLESIREELRDNNELLRKMNNGTSDNTQLSPPIGDIV